MFPAISNKKLIAFQLSCVIIVKKSEKAGKNKGITMKKRHTFTLVEILTTIAILAILAGISLGVTKLAFGKAHESKNQALIKMIEVALEQYKSKYGYYPNSGENPQLFMMDMVDLTKSQADVDSASEANKTKISSKLVTNNIWQFFDENFKKTFVKLIPVDNNIFYGYVIDAKGNPLIYRCPGIFNTGSFDLGSVGEDELLGERISSDTNKDNRLRITVSRFWKLDDKDFHTTKKNEEIYNNFGQGDDIVNFTNNEQ